MRKIIRLARALAKHEALRMVAQLTLETEKNLPSLLSPLIIG